jgi:hypothetical protein
MSLVTGPDRRATRTATCASHTVTSSATSRRMGQNAERGPLRVLVTHAHPPQ